MAPSHNFTPQLIVSNNRKNRVSIFGALLFRNDEEAHTFFKPLDTFDSKEFTVDLVVTHLVGQAAKLCLAQFCKTRTKKVHFKGCERHKKFFEKLRRINNKVSFELASDTLVDPVSPLDIPNRFVKVTDKDYKNCFTTTCPKVWEILDKIIYPLSKSPQQVITLTGETGVGKTSLAKEIARITGKKIIHVNVSSYTNPDHFLSELFGRAAESFTGVSKSEGLIGQAQDNILFLDEIGDIPIEIQNQFLTLIENRNYFPLGSGGSDHKLARCTFIFATNKNLEQLVTQGKFREDLYYRLKSQLYLIPSLKERPKDIFHLLNTFISKGLRDISRKEISVDPKIYDWFIYKSSLKENVRAIEIPIKTAILESFNDELLLSDFEPISNQLSQVESSVSYEAEENKELLYDSAINYVKDGGSLFKFAQDMKSNIVRIHIERYPHKTKDQIAHDLNMSRAQLYNLFHRED